MRRLLPLTFVTAALLAACTTNPYTGEQQASKAATYGAGAAAACALVGAIESGQHARNAALGCGIVGAGVGAYMDVQESKLREQLQGTGVQVVREGDNIRLIMPGSITFQTDSYNLRPEFYATLNSVALVLSKYADTTIRVTGHTDRSGSEQYNVKLGQQRADAVRETLLEALKKQTIDASRIAGIPTDSLGESAPAVATRDGVQEARNRRVEIAVSVGSVRPPPPPKKIDLTPIPPLPGTDRPLGPRRDPSPGDDLWKRMEEQRRKIEEYDRKHPRKTRSLQDVVIGKVMEDIVDPIVKKLPLSKDLREKVRDGIRKGLESGSEKACEAAVDASGATGSEAEALKSACKAALKAKSGGGGP